MLWFKSWAIGFVISSVVTIAVFGFHRPFGVLTDYLEVPLLLGSLLSHELFRLNGPPVGIIFLVIFAIPPLISGCLVYGFIVYVILRLRNELRKGNRV